MLLKKTDNFCQLVGGDPTGQPLTRRIATWEASHKQKNATWEASHKKNCYLASLSQEELLLGKPLTRKIATWSHSQEELLLGKPFTRRIATWQAPTRRNATKHRPGGLAPRANSTNKQKKSLKVKNLKIVFIVGTALSPAPP